MSVREAAAAVRRGSTQEALVVLWNEIERARLAGDRSALAQIEGLARRIVAEGDEAERREAERLLEATHTAAEADALGGVAHAVDGDATPVTFEAEPTTTAPEGEPSSGLKLGPLIWFLVVLGVVVFNLLGRLQE